MVNGGMTAPIVESFGKVVVHGPSCISDSILKLSACFHIVLVNYISTPIPSAFSLSREKTNPVQCPVFTAMVTIVFHVIPYTESNFQQFVTEIVRVVDAVSHTPKLYPPEIGVYSVVCLGHIGIGRKFICPFRRGIRLRMVHFPVHQNTAHAHSFCVPLHGSNGFVEFRPCFSAHDMFRTGKGGKDGVTGTVRKKSGRDGVVGFAVQGPAGNG